MSTAYASEGNGSSPGLRGFADPLVYRMVASSADLALVLNAEGVIVDVWLGDTLEKHPGWQALIGLSWADTVMRDSRAKVEQLLGEALEGHTIRAREINQIVDGVGELPLRFGAARIDGEHVVALGQDIRPLAELQQRMVSAQQAMDQEYRRLRQADTRYRVLFHVCAEGVLVTKGPEHTVVEANPAASTLLGKAPEQLRGKPLHELFAASSRDRLSELLGAATAGANTQAELEARDPPAQELVASAATFRQTGTNLVLFRFWRRGAAGPGVVRERRMLQVIDAMPDGFVVTGEDSRILSANAGFCELVHRPDEAHVIGMRLDRWLGRPGVDLNILLANLREHGVVRNFATIVRGEYGTEQEALVTAVSAVDGRVPSYGFTIRTVTAKLEDPLASTTFLPRSVDQLRGLVGRVPLKEIIRESADMIERLCIEAALHVSHNNRAAAAQLLGLSRQSLYSKLRRHGLGEFQPS